ncbi:MAG: hypothetical protein SGJ17_05020 [Hyphomicrobiales bacterium]|nr:hypothetical protein [Hyphomicrobiales bacterium]
MQNYPVQAHTTCNDLKMIVSGDGFKKSIIEQGERLHAKGPTGWGTLAGTSNIIINNHFDLEVFRLFTLGSVTARTLAENPRFKAVGHAMYMTYSHTIGVLASSVDEEFTALPDFRQRNTKEKGYYYGSPIELWPIGSHEIFEGQARFSQSSIFRMLAATILIGIPINTLECSTACISGPLSTFSNKLNPIGRNASIIRSYLYSFLFAIWPSIPAADFRLRSRPTSPPSSTM